MELFWNHIKTRIQELETLDQDSNLVCGSKLHRYKILRPVDLGDIESYEAKHGIRLPEVYRNYLQYFGSGGVGPYLGINRFPEKIWQGNLTKPLKLELFKGFQFGDDPFPASLEECDGMIEIGCYNGELASFLVVNGALRGHVVSWNRADMLGISGPFDKWFERWIDCSIIGIKHFDVMKNMKVGMNFDDVVEKEGLLVSSIKIANRVRLRFIKGTIELNAERQVEKVNLEHPPAGQSGFLLWPYED